MFHMIVLMNFGSGVKFQVMRGDPTKPGPYDYHMTLRGHSLQGLGFRKSFIVSQDAGVTED